MGVRQKEKAAAIHKRKMHKLFEEADDSGDGILSREEFIQVVSTSSVKTWLASMELDAGDAETLWSLLDDGDGHLTADELIKGVARLKGAARSIDLATLMHEHRHLKEFCETYLPNAFSYLPNLVQVPSLTTP